LTWNEQQFLRHASSEFNLYTHWSISTSFNLLRGGPNPENYKEYQPVMLTWWAVCTKRMPWLQSTHDAWMLGFSPSIADDESSALLILS
jgi:hypothetical protein